MRIGIVGSGISGLICAWLLGPEHEVVLIEGDDRIGGHSHTVEVEHEGRTIAVDTGFIVYNERNYPNLTRVFAMLGVETQPASMSFSVRDDARDLEYGGASLGSLLAQRRNLLRPAFGRFLLGVRRFFREAPGLIERAPEDQTLGAFLRQHGFGREVVDWLVIPMGAAIWSTSTRDMLDFPARLFVRFFHNHGMLQVRGRPEWRTVVGGSRQYVSAMLGQIRGEVRLATRVERVERDDDGVRLAFAEGGGETFDEVILACHSDQALGLLGDPSDPEREILGALPYTPNDVVLHTDASVLPGRRSAWSAWNFLIGRDAERVATVSYNLTMLQSLGTRAPLVVSLNQTGLIDPAKILGRWRYDHPRYTVEGERARARHAEISGVRRTHYCGAYWFNGFHEDGVRSALRVCERFGASL